MNKFRNRYRNEKTRDGRLKSMMSAQIQCSDPEVGQYKHLLHSNLKKPEE